MATQPLLVDLAAWPGIVLQLSDDGTVRASNGVLDALRGGTSIVGRRVADLLDDESSARKWARMLSPQGVNGPAKWELMFEGDARILDPRTFTVTRSGADVWLVEHPTDPRLHELNEHVAQMNSELTTTQRTLFKEQQRLAHALADVERSNAALDEFAHAVSHDLKAPLRAIIDYAQLLSTGATTQLDEEQRGYVARLAVLSLRMRAMIDAVLQYARAGRMTSPVERVDSADLIRAIIDFLAPPPSVRIELAPDLPVFDAERVPLEQVLRNLIGNAITYRRSDGARVRIEAVRAEGGWEFVVADNGPGIAPSQQARIWRLFQTAGPSAPGDSSGIGLALVKRIVEAQGGRVWVESTLDDGSRFHVLWPSRPGRAERRTA